MFRRSVGDTSKQPYFHLSACRRSSGAGIQSAIQGEWVFTRRIEDCAKPPAPGVSQAAHQEFLKFLRRLDRAFPPDLTLHIILDNYGTHKHEAVRKWLAAHPRFKLHFTPTSSSWLNLVESWFSKLTQQRLRRGVFCSVQELVAAIKDYLTHHNANPKPFVWSTTVETILGKIRKCKAIIETYH